jgi:signal transduction histidine kinase
MERIFDDRSSPARLIVLIALGLGGLKLLNRPEDATDWALALAGLAAGLAAWFAPLAAPVAASALLLLGDQLNAHVAVSLKAVIAVTLFEAALRCRGRDVAIVSGVVALAVGHHALHDSLARVPVTLYRLAILLGLPLLIGAHIRLMRRNVRQARDRARAAERTAIARELHDLVAHHVSSMVLRVGVARHVLGPSDPRVDEVLGDLHASGTAALGDLRNLVAVLRDPALVHGEPGVSLVERAGLVDALDAAVERGRQAGLTITADIDPAVSELDGVRRLTVLRLAQEGLANVAKHAGAGTSVTFTVRAEGAAVRLEIVDDGKPGPAKAGGHGLVGMTERVELLGGTLAAGPRQDGSGWRLLAEVAGSAA